MALSWVVGVGGEGAPPCLGRDHLRLRSPCAHPPARCLHTAGLRTPRRAMPRRCAVLLQRQAKTVPVLLQFDAQCERPGPIGTCGGAMQSCCTACTACTAGTSSTPSPWAMTPCSSTPTSSCCGTPSPSCSRSRRTWPGQWCTPCSYLPRMRCGGQGLARGLCSCDVRNVPVRDPPCPAAHSALHCLCCVAFHHRAHVGGRLAGWLARPGLVLRPPVHGRAGRVEQRLASP